MEDDGADLLDCLHRELLDRDGLDLAVLLDLRAAFLEELEEQAREVLHLRRLLHGVRLEVLVPELGLLGGQEVLDEEEGRALALENDEV